MKQHHRDNLKLLFERFLDPAEAETGVEEVRAAERILDAYPAPTPDSETIASLKRQITAHLRRRRWLVRLHRSAAVAAVVAVVVLAGLFGRGPTPPTRVSYASIIPAAIWESDDLAGEDLELAYFNAEIDQIEAQMRRLESGDEQVGTSDRVEELEMEFMQIETQFWKE
jgi:hypothetical protein